MCGTHLATWPLNVLGSTCGTFYYSWRVWEVVQIKQHSKEHVNRLGANVLRVARLSRQVFWHFNLNYGNGQGCSSVLYVYVAVHAARLKLLCLCPLDQCSALFRRLCSAGCQLPIGHRHHLPAQRRMREEDLHPSRIHADGCRLVEMRAQPELRTLRRWRQINSRFFPDLCAV